MSGAGWIDSMRGAGVVEVAHALGMDGDSKRGLYGCPQCGATSRHPGSKDKRGALLIAGAGAGWRCIQCDAAGDALNLVSYSLQGCKISELDADSRPEVREWCERYTGTEARAARPAAPSHVEKPYPPADEIAALWASCRRVDESDPVKAWCAVRGFDASAIADRDLARALPSSEAGPLPEWAKFGKNSWRQDGYHLIVPLFDANGDMRSVIARCIIAPREFHGGGSAPKSVPPKGFRRSALVMACARGRKMLQGEYHGTDGSLDVYVAEGEGDFLYIAGMGEPDGSAVLGIFSGSVKGPIFASVPDGARVIVATDDDVQGDKYAASIAEVLAERARAEKLTVCRWLPGT